MLVRRPIAALHWILVATAIPLAAQEVRRLPPVEDGGLPEGRLMEHREERADFGRSAALADIPLPEPLPPPDGDELPPGARDGVFQKATLESTWLAPGSGASGVGVTDVEVKSVFGFPCPTRTSPLVVTPGFAVHLFDGPQVSDLPPEVFDAYLQFRWMSRVTPRLGVDFAVTPGWYSDFEHGGGDALRITGHGAGAYTWSPSVKLVFGVAYLDRRDVAVLPIGGLIWTPREEWSFELVSPRPRLARRVYWNGAAATDPEQWIYLAGEFGGGTWSIERADGSPDVLTARDYRLILGMERKVVGGLNSLFEVGYVFGRRYEYERGTPDVRPSDTVLLRAGVTY
ncbi:MAG: hypothetical protein NUV77_16230 [Thermoguttaceae bacterium]|jgi:hypothetical protein|nr:hypothetical protein [Thermoguttaceae bacterium]